MGALSSKSPGAKACTSHWRGMVCRFSCRCERQRLEALGRKCKAAAEVACATAAATDTAAFPMAPPCLPRPARILHLPTRHGSRILCRARGQPSENDHGVTTGAMPGTRQTDCKLLACENHRPGRRLGDVPAQHLGSVAAKVREGSFFRLALLLPRSCVSEAESMGWPVLVTCCK